MAERFFTPALADDRAFLDGPEAHHLAHVVRAKPGSEVVLFDGAGSEAVARVDRVSRSRVELTVRLRRRVDRERAADIMLAVALPKGDRQRWLVEKAVELGVRRLVPLATERGVAEATPAALARLRRVVIEASKQCGRNTLMEIAEPAEWAAFAAAPNHSPRWLAHPGGELLAGIVRSYMVESDRSGRSSVAFPGCALAIGPEGGFTAEEVAHGRAAGWRVVDLGPCILRIETAAALLVAAACLIAGDGPVGSAGDA